MCLKSLKSSLLLLLLNQLCVNILANNHSYTNTVIPQALFFEKSCKFLSPGGGCRCVLRHHPYRSSYTKCCCVGHDITRIPSNFSAQLGMLFLYGSGILEISEESFNNYPRLEEIFIDSAKELRRVDSEAFRKLPNLRKIRISNCPNLEVWNGILLKENFKIQSVIARNNGLKQLPRLQMFPNQHFLTIEMLDFSFNNIQAITTGSSLNVNAKVLKLENNAIARVEPFAFVGCKFLKLNLNNNLKMKDISLDAFANTSELHHLDLSHTSIDRLPVKGLKKIQQLTLKDVPRLKHLPSVLAFNNLVKAEFTYAAHCCFFKYATREYKKSSQYQDHYQEIQHRICRRQQQNSKFNFFKPSPRFERDIERFQRNPTGYPLSRKSWTTSKQAEDSEESDLFEDLAKWYKKLDFGALKIPDNLLNTSSSSSEAEQDSEEQPAYTGDKLGQSVILKKCDETAVDDFYLNITCTPQPDALNPCEDIVSYKPLRVVIWVMWIIAIVGNVAVWVVIITVWQRRMRLHYFFMLNLSFADFLTGVYLAILAVADLKTSNEYYNYAVNWQTGWGCSAAGFISVFASELSVFSMLMIAGEIYYNAKYAFFGKRMTTKAACLFMSLGYFYAFSMASLPLMGVSSYQRSSICLPLSINSITDRVYIMIGLSLSAAAFASMVFNYIMINCMIRNPDGPSREEDRQILLKTLVLIGTDMICWVPTLFLGLTAAMGLPLITLTNAKVCLILVYPINSCANPLLYVFLTKIWKDAKLKAAPILELISRQYDKRNSVSMNRFYYSAGPGEQDECASSVKSSPKLTSCVSSPLIKQGKLCLTVNKSAHNLLNTSSIRSNEEATDQKRLSRVSFQDSVLLFAAEKRKSLSTRPKISAVPEMSDISETSSNSANADKDEANIDQANKMSTSSKRSSQLFQPIINMDKRNSSTSIGKDSGRGDSCCSSLTSNGLLMNRPSVVTMDWEGPVVRHINTPTFLVTDYSDVAVDAV